VKPTVGVTEAAPEVGDGTTHVNGHRNVKADVDGETRGRGPTFGGHGSPGVTGVDGRDDTRGEGTLGNKRAIDAADGGSTAGGTEAPGAK
jgi:hypothetical protein